MLVGIISDIHEDVVRLKEAIKLLEKRNVDEIICLGDSVGYCIPYYGYHDTRNANDVIDIIKANCSNVVIGNHDLYAIRQLPEHRKFFDYPSNWYELDFNQRKALSKDKVFLYEDNELASLLTTANKDYIRSLPEYEVKKFSDHLILLSHYAFPDCTGSATLEISSSDELNKQFDMMKSKNCIYGFSGNDHFEGFRTFQETGETNDYTFGDVHQLNNVPTWLHGPTVSWGTFDNGILIYNSETRSLEAVPLLTKKHVIPTYV